MESERRLYGPGCVREPMRFSAPIENRSGFSSNDWLKTFGRNAATWLFEAPEKNSWRSGLMLVQTSFLGQLQRGRCHHFCKISLFLRVIRSR